MFGVEQCNPPSRFIKDIPEEMINQGQGSWIEGQGARGMEPGARGKGQGESFERQGLGGMGKSGAESLDQIFLDPCHLPLDPSLDPCPLPIDPRLSHNLAAAAEYTDEIESIPEPCEENDGVYLGMKVRHGKFGVGTVKKVEGDGDGQKVIVWFKSVGPKKLLLRFAGLERV